MLTHIFNSQICINYRGVEVSWLKQTYCYLHDNLIENVLLIQRQQVFFLLTKMSHFLSHFQCFDGRNFILLCLVPLY